MIEAKFFTVGTYLYKYNLTVLFVSPSKIAHDKFYIYCPPLLLNEIYAHDYTTFAPNSKEAKCVSFTKNVILECTVTTSATKEKSKKEGKVTVMLIINECQIMCKRSKEDTYGFNFS